MSLTIGIVGLPNVGKSTLFNALTKNDVLAANYPFATIEPNVGVVGLPDERLDMLAELFDSEKIIPAPVSFVDIAGLVRGASKGQGRGNAFLANIRDASAICQVVRAFSDPNVLHVDGKISPADDIETINTELILADLQTVEKALPRLQKEAKLKKDRARRGGRRRGRVQAAQRRRHALHRAPPPPASTIELLARAAPADHQTVPVRLQRRRGRAGQRGVPRRDARPGRPGRGRLHGRARSSPS